MFKTISATAAALLALVAMSHSAFSHTPHDVEHILQDRGYSRIEFISTNPSNYMANGCRDGIRYHFHVNNYGEVTERREIGTCYGENNHRSRRFWTSPRY